MLEFSFVDKKRMQHFRDASVFGHGCKSVTYSTTRPQLIISQWVGLSYSEGSLWVSDAAPVCCSRMQTHHLSHRVRGQRYMWATVTRLKVTLPDKSNLLHWHERLDWCVSHLLAMPRRRSGIDGRAAWWAVPTPYLSVCLFITTALRNLSQRQQA